MTNGQNEEPATPAQSDEDINPTLRGEPEPSQLLNVALALGDVARRLGAVEESFSLASGKKHSLAGAGMEFLRLFFGGWPAFALLALLLFYSPLRAALDAVPDKIRGAEEIGLMGVSLKTTIRVQAQRLGEAGLAQKIPSLSRSAIELFMKLQDDRTPMMATVINDNSEIIAVCLPKEDVVVVISELMHAGLVNLVMSDNALHNKMYITSEVMRKEIDAFKKKNPGKIDDTVKDGRINVSRYDWQLDDAIPRSSDHPWFQLELTDLGKIARELIVSAVAAELSSKNVDSYSD